jgi:hypothetical protein
MSKYLDSWFDEENRKKADVLLSSILNGKTDYNVIVSYGGPRSGKTRFTQLLSYLESRMIRSIFDYEDLPQHERNNVYVLELQNIEMNLDQYDNVGAVVLHFVKEFQPNEEFNTEFHVDMENHVNELVSMYRRHERC